MHPDLLRPLIQKISNHLSLSTHERDALVALRGEIRSLAANEDVVRDGDRPHVCCIILKGFACRYKITREGKRQIFSFHVSGDMPDLQSLHLHVMDHSLGAIVPSEIASIPHEEIHALVDEFPRLAGALWRDTLSDAAVFREWMVGIGRRTPYQRIAHLICEMYLRNMSVGLVKDETFFLPLTQETYADALGLSTIHAHRILKKLSEDGLIDRSRKQMHIPDWAALKEAADFEETYLHLRRAE